MKCDCGEELLKSDRVTSEEMLSTDDEDHKIIRRRKAKYVERVRKQRAIIGEKFERIPTTVRDEVPATKQQ